MLSEEGDLTSPRGMQTLELLNTRCTLTNPKNSIVTLKSRKLSHKYLNAEFSWYKSGDLHINKIKNYSKMWEKLADDFGYVNSNYGYWAKHYENDRGWTQWRWCGEELMHDPHSRRAIINFNLPEHKYGGVKDFPCTIMQHFYIRKGKLDCTVYMRSNDLIYGFCYDVPYFTYLQRELAHLLNVSVGDYHHLTTSMHVYERHFDMMSKIIKEVEEDDI